MHEAPAALKRWLVHGTGSPASVPATMSLALHEMDPEVRNAVIGELMRVLPAGGVRSYLAQLEIPVLEDRPSFRSNMAVMKLRLDSSKLMIRHPGSMESRPLLAAMRAAPSQMITTYDRKVVEATPDYEAAR